MSTYIKTEDANQITYTDDASGVTVTVKKDDNLLDIHQVLPNRPGKTWRDVRDALADKVQP